MANPADHLACVASSARFSAVELREKVTALVDRERFKDEALRNLVGAVEELLELAPKGSDVRRLADRVLEKHLKRARALVAA